METALALVIGLGGLVALVAAGGWVGLRERGLRSRAESAVERAQEELNAIERGEQAAREWDSLSPDEQWERLSDDERD